MEGNASDSVKRMNFLRYERYAMMKESTNKAWAKLIEKRDEFMSVSEINTVDMAEVPMPMK